MHEDMVTSSIELFDVRLGLGLKAYISSYDLIVINSRLCAVQLNFSVMEKNAQTYLY